MKIASSFKPEPTLKQQNDYLDKNVFYGLTNLNDGFDVETIKYFSEKDFAIVLERVKKLGIGIMGIEPFKDRMFYDVDTGDDYSGNAPHAHWYMEAFERFKKRDSGLMYAASYIIPDSI